MKIGHGFSTEHGFSGSAHPSKNMRPMIPGYKHGGMDKDMSHKEYGNHPKNKSNHREDEHGFQIHKGHKKRGGKMDSDGDYD